MHHEVILTEDLGTTRVSKSSTSDFLKCVETNENSKRARNCSAKLPEAIVMLDDKKVCTHQVRVPQGQDCELTFLYTSAETFL